MFCRSVYMDLVKDGTIVPAPEKKPPTVPMDYTWAQVTQSLQNTTHYELRACLRASL